MNLLQALQAYGQSVLDYIRHYLITSGELQQIVAAGEVWGVTSNPAIFEKAIVAMISFLMLYLLSQLFRKLVSV